jgi:hypothetical protein
MKIKKGETSGIAVFDNAIEPEICDAIIRFFEKDGRLVKGRTVGGQNSMVKSTMDGYLEASMFEGDDAEECKMLQGAFFLSLQRCVQDYINHHNALVSQWQHPQDSGFQYQKYEKGTGFYSWHYDGGPYREINVARRVIATVSYLNTVEEGGETVFDEMATSVKPKQGRIVIFPTGFLWGHKANIPQSSDKHMISTFLTGFTTEEYEREVEEITESHMEEMREELLSKKTIVDPLEG